MADLLDADAVRRALDRRDGWTGGVEGITRTYRFRDFVAAMGFLQRVALLSERASHHPDVELSYDTVALTIRSHAAGGVTQACLDLADSVDEYA